MSKCICFNIFIIDLHWVKCHFRTLLMLHNYNSLFRPCHFKIWLLCTFSVDTKIDIHGIKNGCMWDKEKCKYYSSLMDIWLIVCKKNVTDTSVMNWKLGLTDQIIFQSFVFQHLIGTLKYPHKNPGGRYKITYISSEEIDCVNKRHTENKDFNFRLWDKLSTMFL